MPRPYVDGGYYTKLKKNRPLIGPLKIPGAFVCGAFSGFGIMSACGAGELLARHITKSDLPDYADAFLPSRYEDPYTWKKSRNGSLMDSFKLVL